MHVMWQMFGHSVGFASLSVNILFAYKNTNKQA